MKVKARLCIAALAALAMPGAAFGFMGDRRPPWRHHLG
jgi:hypothetical protein